jgi:hypothetical protein
MKKKQGFVKNLFIGREWWENFFNAFVFTLTIKKSGFKIAVAHDERWHVVCTFFYKRHNVYIFDFEFPVYLFPP